MDDLGTLAALVEPTRRRVYEHVATQPQPVSREETAVALALARATAAFHLDRLVDAGLLTASFARRTGRTGPGAGRPAKLYARSHCEVAVTLPPRRYDVAAALLAAAVDGTTPAEDPRDVLDREAYAFGRAVGAAARPETGGTRAVRAAVLDCLVELGYEPRSGADGGTDSGVRVVLANCPFHHLARAHTQLVCQANLRLLDGLLDGVGATGLTAELRPTPDRCCVVVADTAAGRTGAETSADPVAVLRRWEDSGGHWRVVHTNRSQLSIALLTCDSGQEMGRIVSAAPELLAYVAGRPGSDEPAT